MKKLNKFLFLFLATTASFFSSCTVDVEPLDPAVIIPQPSTNGQLKVDFDGQTFVATNVQASISNNAIAITGLRSGNNDLIQITLPAPLNQVGTYNWANATASNAVLGLIYSNSASQAFISVPNDGEFSDFPTYTDTALVTVSSINTENKTISGTFEFTGARFDASDNLVVKKFTNGSFTNISYSGDTVNPSTNSFSAKMWTAPFVATTITAATLSGKIDVTGKTTDMGNINVSFPASIVAGTYPISLSGDYKAKHFGNNTQQDVFDAESGNLIIISHTPATKKIKATFSFLGKSVNMETIPISEGTFEVTYQ